MYRGQFTARLCRSAALGVVLAASAPALAQQTDTTAQPTAETVKPPEAPAENPDRVVITGSRIARDAFTSTAPIQVITAEQSTLEGLVDTGEILQGSTMASGSVQFNNQFGGFVIEGGPGINSVSLRGLGAQRSLVLLNGKRPGPAGVRGQVGSFDLNVIPDAIISRVEILKDGASSIYGSDAVAGVANIITRNSVDRPELTAQYNATEGGGGNTLQINGAWGTDLPFGGTLMLAAEYEQRDPLLNKDRKYLSCAQDLVYDPVTGQRLDRRNQSILAGPPCRNTQVNILANLFTNQIYIPSPDGITEGPIPGYRLRRNTTYANSASPYYEDVWDGDIYQNAHAIAAVDRLSLYGRTDIALGDIDWTTEALFTRREYSEDSWRQFFPTIGGSAFYNDPSGPAWESPFGAVSAVQAVALFPSWQEVNIDYYYASTGLKGNFNSLPILSNFTWSLDASYSHSEGEYSSLQILKDTAGDAQTPTTQGLYRAPAYNPFDPAFLSGHPSAALVDLLTETDTGTTTYDQTTITGVVSGDLFDLPAGPLGMAVGAEWRSFELDDTPGQGSIDDIYWGTSTANPTRGDDTVSEMFAEFNIPVLRGMPLIEEFTVDASARAFNYDSYGSDSVWKAGFNWQVVPSVRVRGTKGTSYRAPALFELFLNDQTSFLGQTLIDPCIRWEDSTNENLRANCAAEGIPGNYAGGGADATISQGGGAGRLSAETSTAQTLGLIWTPDFIDLSIAIDYFDIVIEDQVVTLGSGTIVNGCYAAPVYPNAFCDLFERNLPTHPTAPNVITSVTDNYLNANQQATHGIDITVRYEHEFDFGDLTVDLEATHTMEDVNLLFDANQSSGFNTSDFNGTIGDPEWVANASLQLRQGDYTYSWFVDYIGPTDNSPFANELFTYNGRTARRILRTDDWFSHDASVRWRGDNLTITGGISNVFNAPPPAVSVGSTQRLGTAPLVGTQYDLRGRTFFVRLGYEF